MRDKATIITVDELLDKLEEVENLMDYERIALENMITYCTKEERIEDGLDVAGYTAFDEDKLALFDFEIYINSNELKSSTVEIPDVE